MEKVIYGPAIKFGLRYRKMVELKLSTAVWDDADAWGADCAAEGAVFTERYRGKKTVAVAMDTSIAKNFMSYLDHYADRYGPDDISPQLRRAYKRAAIAVRNQLRFQLGEGVDWL